MRNHTIVFDTIRSHICTAPPRGHPPIHSSIPSNPIAAIPLPSQLLLSPPFAALNSSIFATLFLNSRTGTSRNCVSRSHTSTANSTPHTGTDSAESADSHSYRGTGLADWHRASVLSSQGLVTS